MNIKTLLDKEDVDIEGRKYFISRMPAVQAQRLFLAGFGALNNHMMSGIPPAMVDELLSYCGTYNNEGAEVQFVNSDIINMFVTDVFDLVQLEHKMVRKNYGFLFDGRGAALAAQLPSTHQDTESSNIETSTP